MATNKGFGKGSDVKCSICNKKNKETKAEYYCYDCQKDLCESCCGTHNDFIEDHTVEYGHRYEYHLLNQKCIKPEEEQMCIKCCLRKHSCFSTDIDIGFIDVRIPEDDTKCDITGCCQLSDGRLVIADRSNKRLKVVDPNQKSVTMLRDTDDRPTDVCFINSQQFAVAFGSTEVHVYNAESMTRARTIELKLPTFKISCHGQLLYFAALMESTNPGAAFGNTLQVHDLHDDRTPRMICPKDLELFPNITGITLDSPGNLVYVSDRDRGLVCVHKDGQIRFHLSEGHLGVDVLTRVTTGHGSRLFICGKISNNVVEVTNEGQVLGKRVSLRDVIELEKKGIQWDPLCLSYDESKRLLYVGGKSDKLLIVNLK